MDCIGGELFIVLAQLRQQGAVGAQGSSLFETIARMNLAGGRVESLTHNRSRGNAAWLLRVCWPKSLTPIGYHRPQENSYPSAGCRRPKLAEKVYGKMKVATGHATTTWNYDKND